MAVDRELAWLLADDYFALGNALFVQGRDEAAEAALRESLARHAALGTADAAWAAPTLATLLAVTGRHGTARPLIVASLRDALDQRAFLPLLWAMLAAALALGQAGDAARAAELAALVGRFDAMAKGRGLMDRVLPALDAALGSIGAAELTAAERRGRARDPWAAARDLLRRLTEEGWETGAQVFDQVRSPNWA
jgi:hypothetical protein